MHMLRFQTFSYRTYRYTTWLSSALLGFMVMLIAGCTSHLPDAPPVPPQALQQPSDQFEPIARLQQLNNNSYILEDNDIIQIRVDGKEPTTHQFIIDPQGTIDYPPLGKVQVQGLTLDEVAERISHRLASSSHRTPSVSASMVQYRNQHVYVLGAVRTPGVHPLPLGTSLLELIAQAGGPAPEASWIVLVIKRSSIREKGGEHVHEGKTMQEHNTEGLPQPAAIRFDLDELMIGAVIPPLRLESGDIIYIPEGGHYYIYGEVERPGRYRLERGMTVIRAITRAGGATPFAVQKRMTVWRYHVHNDECGRELCLRDIARHMITEPPREFRISPHDVLQPGDILVMPGRFNF
jgi:polysaccharide export outer membrane protein